VVTQGPTQAPEPKTPVVVAVQELPRGWRITEDAVDVRQWPQSAAPFNGLTDINDAIGKIARTRIFVEEPILTSMVTDDFTSLAEVGSDAAAVLPPGMLAVSIPINRLTSVSYAIQDGDRVDVILSMLFVDVDDIFQTIEPNFISLFQLNDSGITIADTLQGRPDSTTLGPAIIGPSERQRPRLLTQRTVQNALVVHVGDFPADGRFLGVPPTPVPAPSEDQANDQGTPVPSPTPNLPTVVTLGVQFQDAAVLVWAIEAKLPMTLALRPATDNTIDSTQAVTLDYIMSAFQINPPGKRQYTIEPALRSIRQILDESELTLPN
jgi:pilus assembly protein CpaB